MLTISPRQAGKEQRWFLTKFPMNHRSSSPHSYFTLTAATLSSLKNALWSQAFLKSNGRILLHMLVVFTAICPTTIRLVTWNSCLILKASMSLLKSLGQDLLILNINKWSIRTWSVLSMKLWQCKSPTLSSTFLTRAVLLVIFQEIWLKMIWNLSQMFFKRKK